MSDFDFNPRDSNLNIGIEVEYPAMDRGDEKYVSRGSDTNSLQSSIERNRSWSGPGRAVYDGTVGLEVVSDVLELDDAPSWYANVIDYVEAEHNKRYQPVGLMKGGNTAGLHMHLSSLSTEQARQLYEVSQRPWAKVLFCSSVANEGDDAAWPVFRGGRYCSMDFGGGHYSCVNSRSGDGHFEWRLPEPMVPEHLEIVVRFLALFEQDVELATQYAQEVLDDGDDRITSIRRAEAVGMDIEDTPRVTREPAEEDPENFFDEVREMVVGPTIHRVDYQGDSYYVFESSFDTAFDIAGVSFHPDDVLHADTLEQVSSESVADEIERAFTRSGNDPTRDTEATQELEKIIKKKKS